MLTSVVAGGTSGDVPASFHVAGMRDLPGDRSAHVYWLHELQLGIGSRLQFKLVESESPTPPIETKPTDSPDYVAEQLEFEEVERTWTPPNEPAQRRWPLVTFKLKLGTQSPLAAGVPLGQEHIMCSLLWDKWRPERGRVFVRTFTGFARGTEERTTEWLRGFLLIGEALDLELCA